MKKLIIALLVVCSIAQGDQNAPVIWGQDKAISLPAKTCYGSGGTSNCVLNAEQGYLSGVTSPIQTQINSAVAGAGITALTGDVAATGPGSTAATISGLARSKLAAATASTVVVN